MLDVTHERWRGPSEDGGPYAIGRQGPLEGVRNCRDRATALTEDMWCEKIRGCSYRGGNTSASGRVLIDVRLPNEAVSFHAVVMTHHRNIRRSAIICSASTSPDVLIGKRKKSNTQSLCGRRARVHCKAPCQKMSPN